MNTPQYLIKQLADEITIPDSGKQNRVIADDAKSKVVLFAFAPGSGLAEHVAPLEATIQIISGTAAITVGEKVVDGKPGTWIRMEAKTPHSIQAETATVLLLTLLK
jgi:quercetin dioxygenase-like cupin family protein